MKYCYIKYNSSVLLSYFIYVYETDSTEIFLTQLIGPSNIRLWYKKIECTKIWWFSGFECWWHVYYYVVLKNVENIIVKNKTATYRIFCISFINKCVFLYVFLYWYYFFIYFLFVHMFLRRLLDIHNVQKTPCCVQHKKHVLGAIICFGN